MLPIKYSFKLLKRAEAKKLKLDFAFNELQKKIVIVADAKENFEKNEDLENDNASAELGTSKKRAFLKLAGVVGLGAVASLFIPKRAEALIFGSTPASNVVGIKNSSNVPIDPAIETGGNLTDINANTAPLLVDSAGGYVRQDSTATIAKETGGNLTDIRTALFAGGVVAGTAGGYVRQDSTATIAKETGGNLATIATATSTLATDDAITYLRRMVKQLDSLAVVDSNMRQRVNLYDGTLPTVTTVGTVTTISQFNGVDPKYLYIDTAHNAYANAIRNNLTW